MSPSRVWADVGTGLGGVCAWPEVCLRSSTPPARARREEHHLCLPTPSPRARLGAQAGVCNLCCCVAASITSTAPPGNCSIATPPSTGSRTDLDAAIDVSRQAVATTPLDDPARAAFSSNLAGILGTRPIRTGRSSANARRDAPEWVAHAGRWASTAVGREIGRAWPCPVHSGYPAPFPLSVSLAKRLCGRCYSEGGQQG
jgi:hypothetical protein